MELHLRYMARANTTIGDVFEVKLDESIKKYFQYVTNDLTQLNSDVIRVFKSEYSIDSNANLSNIVNDEIDFYAHCVTKFGVKMGLWKKIGNIREVGDLEVLFRDTNDAGSRPGEQIFVSSNWYVWKINDVDFTVVGKLEGVNRNAEIGVVVNPLDIVSRMKTGQYNFFYPGFE